MRLSQKKLRFPPVSCFTDSFAESKVPTLFREGASDSHNSSVLSFLGAESVAEDILLAQATSGDEHAFALLAERYRTRLCHLAFRFLRNKDDAYDAVQETLFKAFRSIRDFDSSRPFQPWIFRICTNCCIDVARQRKREFQDLSHETCAEDRSELEAAVGGTLLHSQIVEAISRLPERYRLIIQMRHFKDMDVKEIANSLEKPEGTIKSWLFRARAMLKKDLRFAF